MIANNISLLSKKIPSNVQLVAVSKTKPNELLMEAYDYGQRHFGENKVQELVSKHEDLPHDINWHFMKLFHQRHGMITAFYAVCYSSAVFHLRLM